MVYDQTHIGLVNPHSKCNRSHNDMHIFLEEGVLMSRAGSTVEPRVVGEGGNSVELKKLSNLFHFLPR